MSESNESDPYSHCIGTFLPFTDESTWDIHFRRFLYFIGFLWSVIGVSIVTDILMSAIVVITNRTKMVKRTNPNGDQPNTAGEKEVRVWSDTVANLTLVPLGAGAPIILLSIIDFESAGLFGATAIVATAVLSLLITALSIIFVPVGETRRIDLMKVFVTITSFTLFGYLWLYLNLQVISPKTVEIYEAAVTLLLFPTLVVTAFLINKGICCRTKRDTSTDTELELGIGTY